MVVRGVGARKCTSFSKVGEECYKGSIERYSSMCWASWFVLEGVRLEVAIIFHFLDTKWY